MKKTCNVIQKINNQNLNVNKNKNKDWKGTCNAIKCKKRQHKL